MIRAEIKAKCPSGDGVMENFEMFLNGESVYLTQDEELNFATCPRGQATADLYCTQE
jgi:hypothetical protein